MELTKEMLAEKIIKFLNRHISSEEFASWAETAMIENDYEEAYFNEISNILAKIGVVNVKGFELPVAFYLNSLVKLNYQTVFNLKPKRQKVKEFAYV